MEYQLGAIPALVADERDYSKIFLMAIEDRDECTIQYRLLRVVTSGERLKMEYPRHSGPEPKRCKRHGVQIATVKFELSQERV